MRFLTRQRNEHTDPWWDEALDTEDVPLVVRELLSDRSVLTTPAEAEAALVWARRFATWDDAHPALVFVEDPA